MKITSETRRSTNKATFLAFSAILVAWNFALCQRKTKKNYGIYRHVIQYCQTEICFVLFFSPNLPLGTDVTVFCSYFLSLHKNFLERITSFQLRAIDSRKLKQNTRRKFSTKNVFLYSLYLRHEQQQQRCLLIEVSLCSNQSFGNC